MEFKETPDKDEKPQLPTVVEAVWVKDLPKPQVHICKTNQRVALSAHKAMRGDILTSEWPLPPLTACSPSAAKRGRCLSDTETGSSLSTVPSQDRDSAAGAHTGHMLLAEAPPVPQSFRHRNSACGQALLLKSLETFTNHFLK